jgi:hypothetical protein
MSTEVLVAITMDSDEPLRILAFQCYGRGSALPSGATWTSTPGEWAREPTAENLAAEVHRSCPPVGSAGIPLPQPVSWRLVSRADLEVLCADRTFRDALIDDGKTVSHHLPTARTIHRRHLRAHRVAALAKLDIAYQRADEQNDPAEKARVMAAKQVLRDLPAHPAIDAATTVQELKAVWPDELL